MRNTVTIGIGNLYILVKDFKPDTMFLIKKFCRNKLTKFSKVGTGIRGRTRWSPTHVFARTNNDKTEVRLPIGVLREFKDYLISNGYKEARIKEYKIPDSKETKVKVKIKEAFKNPRPNQKEWLEYQLGEGAIKVNQATMGTGKSQPNYSGVLTRGGFARMGDIQVGDVVLNRNLKEVRVKNVYPQGLKEIVEVTLEDNRRTECCLEHLWKIYVSIPKTSLNPPEDINDYIVSVVTTKELKALLEQNRRVYIDLIDNGEEKKEETYLFDDLTEALIKRTEIYSSGGIALVETNCYTGKMVTKITSCYPKNKLIEVRSVELTGKETEMTCIELDDEDNLYVTDNFIVTHNTYMSLYTSHKLATRTLITIQPRYITTWLRDIEKTLDLKPDDILLYEDTRLERLIDEFKGNKNKVPIIIIPITRIIGYLRRSREDSTLPSLDRIYEAMGIGLRVVDETHESFHEITNTLFFGNIKKTIVLSGTLTADDPFLNKMYEAMFPKDKRLKEPDDEHYVDVEAVHYRINTQRYRVNYIQFGNYDDKRFEHSIMRNKDLERLYINLLFKMFENGYMPIREEGTKCLIFVSRIDTALKFKEVLQAKYSVIEIDTYLGSLDKKNPYKYLEPEVIISTSGSLGTGKDIPGLTTVIDFNTVKSSQRNKQKIGRLRNLSNQFEGRITPKYMFTVCENIQPHCSYLPFRIQAFKAKEKTFKRIDSFLQAGFH